MTPTRECKACGEAKAYIEVDKGYGKRRFVDSDGGMWLGQAPQHQPARPRESCPHGHEPYDECPLCHAMVDAIREAQGTTRPREEWLVVPDSVRAEIADMSRPSETEPCDPNAIIEREKKWLADAIARIEPLPAKPEREVGERDDFIDYLANDDCSLTWKLPERLYRQHAYDALKAERDRYEKSSEQYALDLLYAEQERDKLKAQLEVARDAELRTYDGLTTRHDRYRAALEDIGNGAHDSFRCGEIAREALKGAGGEG